MNYIEKSLQGINGTVTDSSSGKLLHAMVFVNNHDKDSSEVYSYLPDGTYHRLINSGKYNITFSSPGYYDKTINDVTLNNDCNSSFTLNVIMDPIKDNIIDLSSDKNEPLVFPNPSHNSFKIKSVRLPAEIADIRMYDILGNEVKNVVAERKANNEINIDTSALSKGIYFTRINVNNSFVTIKTIVY